MDKSWDPYYEYFKEFEFNLFEIYVFKKFKKEINDLGYLEQGIEKWKFDSYKLLSLEKRWIKESIIKII